MVKICKHVEPRLFSGHSDNSLMTILYAGDQPGVRKWQMPDKIFATGAKIPLLFHTPDFMIFRAGTNLILSEH